MIYKSKENPNSHLTIKDRKRPSLPLRFLLKNKKLQGKILDFGCGLGKDVEYLHSNKSIVKGYDPFYFPEYPQEKFDTIICFYVLNVLLPDEQAHVIMAISELLKNGGKAFFAVRRDVKRNAFIYNYKKDVKTYQCNVKCPLKVYSKMKTQRFTNINIILI